MDSRLIEAKLQLHVNRDERTQHLPELPITSVTEPPGSNEDLGPKNPDDLVRRITDLIR